MILKNPKLHLPMHEDMIINNYQRKDNVYVIMIDDNMINITFYSTNLLVLLGKCMHEWPQVALI